MAPKFFPLEYGHIITDTFGWQDWRGGTHWGTDYGWPGGSAWKPVYAMQGGTVIMVGPASGFGRWVVLDHPAADGGGVTVYGHIIPEVGLGQRVEAGQRIATINPDKGTNGGVDAHVHVEWHRYVWSQPGPDRLDPAGMLAGATFPGGTDPAPPPAPAASPLQYGVDVSNHQRGFDFAAAKREGFAFATHKVTEGDWLDPEWPRAREEMRRHFPGLFGGYVYCHVENDPGYEADIMLNYLGDLSIPVQIDYEDLDRNGSGADLRARVQAYLDRGARLLPIYIPRWYWRDRMGAPDLSGLPVGLWNSDYVTGSAAASVLYPGDNYKGWAPFTPTAPPITFLQYSEKGRVAGLSQVDVNAFRGTESDLRAIFGADPKDDDMAFTDADRAMLQSLRHDMDTVHRELTQAHPSRSLYRNTSDPVDTMAGFAINADGRAHEALVEVRALAAKVDTLVAPKPVEVTNLDTKVEA